MFDSIDKDKSGSVDRIDLLDAVRSDPVSPTAGALLMLGRALSVWSQRVSRVLEVETKNVTQHGSERFEYIFQVFTPIP